MDGGEEGAWAKLWKATRINEEEEWKRIFRKMDGGKVALLDYRANFNVCHEITK